jgi:hypothetical protein
MSYEALLIHTVVIENPGDSISVDAYNNPIPGAAVSTTETARIQQKSVEELLAERDTRIGRYNFFGAKDSVITSLSTVTWGPKTFRVTGDPEVVYGLLGPHHVEASLEEVEGA